MTNRAKNIDDILREVRQKMYHIQNTINYVDTPTLRSYEAELSKIINNVEKLNSEAARGILDQLRALIQVRTCMQT